MLTKDAILNADDLVKEKVEIKEWNGFVYVKSLNGEERELFEDEIVKQNQGKATKKSIRALIVALSVVGEDGNKLFTLSDIEKLAKKNWRALDKIHTASVKLNGLDDIEEAEKNSKPAP